MCASWPSTSDFATFDPVLIAATCARYDTGTGQAAGSVKGVVPKVLRYVITDDRDDRHRQR